MLPYLLHLSRLLESSRTTTEEILDVYTRDHLHSPGHLESLDREE
jgi:hypothetical protein